MTCEIDVLIPDRLVVARGSVATDSVSDMTKNLLRVMGGGEETVRIGMATDGCGQIDLYACRGRQEEGEVDVKNR